MTYNIINNNKHYKFNKQVVYHKVNSILFQQSVISATKTTNLMDVAPGINKIYNCSKMVPVAL